MHTYRQPHLHLYTHIATFQLQDYGWNVPLKSYEKKIYIHFLPNRQQGPIDLILLPERDRRY
uniref:Uncharacterized protein n=1 Tax=Octopus bimaculoides TaxID=37653 RepID=A0A0L8GVD6_OCTBM